jgi:DeoR/GlpR family transcriptional regulator of sugar metabolism
VLRGCQVEKSASTPDIIHAEAKKLVMSIVEQVILLFDSSKMGRTAGGVRSGGLIGWIRRMKR